MVEEVYLEVKRSHPWSRDVLREDLQNMVTHQIYKHSSCTINFWMLQDNSQTLIIPIMAWVIALFTWVAFGTSGRWVHYEGGKR